jgi:hypothetical protein
MKGGQIRRLCQTPDGVPSGTISGRTIYRDLGSKVGRCGELELDAVPARDEEHPFAELRNAKIGGVQKRA